MFLSHNHILDVILNTTQFFIANIPNKRELQQIVTNHSSDISSKNFINIYRECTAKPYSLFVNHTTLASDNPLRFRNHFKNIIKVMTIKIRLEMKNSSMILIEKKLKHQLYHQVKFINMNISLAKIYYHLISNKY